MKVITKKRNKIDIMIEAIKITKEYPTKTKLINDLNIGWKKGKKTINILLNKNLIKVVELNHSNHVMMYQITPKGLNLIKIYDEITSQLEYMVIDNKYTELNKVDE